MSATIRERRNTAQKEAVCRELTAADGFISAGELHQRLRDEGSAVGLATVYRQLNALVDIGRADAIPVPGGQLFRACEQGGHHHLVCEDCGTAVDIDPPDEEWIRATAERSGVTVTRHILEVFGRCGACPAE
ncbi:Fur family transcriptional regulator [Microbacterium karelineae]|uniref:Fur family transcriptional regulator n=1 Tax=Microbacterium karelineae TaxID=2654283 RepID=UPI0012EAFC24|nr:transcriptional repressor [Microbacterium karelineae]